MRRALLMLIPLSLAACDAIHASSEATARAVKENYNVERNTWRDVFTYHPPKPPQEPQTRYCYKMQSDVVCYDSVQPTQTARLNGYQDGDQFSFIQPGGGSLGASGGEASAPRMRSGVQAVPGTGADYAMDTSAITVQDTPNIVVAPFNTPLKGSHTHIIANPNIRGAIAPGAGAEKAAAASADVTNAEPSTH